MKADEPVEKVVAPCDAVERGSNELFALFLGRRHGGEEDRRGGGEKNQACLSLMS
jgi:hypothetical protein